MPSQLEALRWTPHFLQYHLDTTKKYCLLGGYISPIPPMKGTRNNHWFLGGQDGSALAYGCDEFRTEFLALSRLFLYEIYQISPTRAWSFFFVISTTKHRNARAFSFTNTYPKMYIFCCSFWDGGFFQGHKMPSKCHRRDKEFIMLAVALNGLCLQYASVELRSDRQVVLQAIRSNPYAFLGYQNI